MKTLVLTLLAILSMPPTFFSQGKNKEIFNYNSGQYELSKESKLKLDQSLKANDAYNASKIVIAGFTDDRGSEAINYKVSKIRAAKVKRYLISKGIKKERIKLEYYGEQNAIASNSTIQGRKMNRRSEIVFHEKESIWTNAFQSLNKETQEFKVNAGEDIEIVGKEGTNIRIPKNSLINNSGMVNGEVTILLQEFYQKSDLIKANLHTMADKKLLETGGTIYVSVRDRAGELTLMNGKKFEIEFPKNGDMKDMQTFEGVQQKNTVNWTTPSQSLLLNEYFRMFSTLRDTIYYRPVIGSWGSVEVKERYYATSVADTAEMTKSMKLGNAMLEAVKFGWINCDRFARFTNRTTLYVETDASLKPILCLVFKDIKAIMPGCQMKGNTFYFDPAPVGQKATLISMTLIDDVPYYVSKDVIIGENTKETLQLMKTTMQELNTSLQKLN